jgi:hypothetical protein
MLVTPVLPKNAAEHHQSHFSGCFASLYINYWQLIKTEFWFTTVSPVENTINDVNIAQYVQKNADSFIKSS